jgi:trigger factor
MKVETSSKKGLKTVLKILIEKKTIDEKIKVRLEEVGRTITLKGFRPGKIPFNVLKSQFGKAVYGEVLEKTLQETSAQAIEEKKIKISGQPKLELKSHGEDKDLNYTLEINELPRVKLKTLENIKFTDYEIKISENEVKKRVDDIAANQNNFKDKKENESAENLDLVIFDYNATIESKNFEGGEGKNTQIVLGKDLFIKGFDKQLIGSKKNQTIDVSAILPENYPKKEFANKKAIFKCKILNIKKPEPIIIDDQFAKNLGAKNLSDLKELVSKQIENQYKMNLESLSKENILNQLEKIHDVEIPDHLLQQELELITKDLNKENSENEKKESEKIAKKRIKLGLILNEIGDKNNLKVEENEIKQEIQKQIQSMPEQQKQLLEYYQKNPAATSNLKGSIYEEKIINLIKDKSKKSKKIISTKEAEQLIKDHHKSHNHSHDNESKKPKKTLKTKEKKKTVRKK